MSTRSSSHFTSFPISYTRNKETINTSRMPVFIRKKDRRLKSTIESNNNQDFELKESEDSSSVNLQYIEFSSDDKSKNTQRSIHEPVIILHGLLGSKRNFSSLGTSLSKQLKKHRRIFAVDLRNHGENHHDWRDTMTYTEMAEDVLQFMNKLHLSKAILVGHSMGGKVAKTMALLSPNRVSGLVVLDIAPVRYCPKTDKSWAAVKNIIDALSSLSLTPGKTKRDIDLELRETVEDPALRAFVLTNLDQQRDMQQLTWKINIESISNQLDVIAGFDLSTAESVYNGDTFIIHGGASRFVRSTHMQTIAEYFPNHMLTTIRGAGHWVHAEAPDDTLALLKRYLDR